MSFTVVLTVAESKRLIAKGIVASDFFRQARERGRILIIKGTTNAYIVEEILGQKIDKMAFARGLTLPFGKVRREPKGAVLGDVLLDHGTVRTDLAIEDAVERLERGDLILKGANALNYERGLAGVLIGDARSGTVGLALRKAVGSHVRLVVPVGLEKQVGMDILAAARLMSEPEHKGEALMPLWGTIFTEIEALAALSGARAFHVGAGGVGGAEGGIRLLVDGTEEQLARARAALEGVLGEPPLE
jgi:hypothetical protein